MRIIRLHEKVSNVPPSNMDAFIRDLSRFYNRRANRANSTAEQRRNIQGYLSKLADKYLGGNKNIVDISDAIATSAEESKNGIANKFITFIGNFSDHRAFKNNNEKFSYVNDIYQRGYTDLDKSAEVKVFNQTVPSIFYDPTLYRNNVDDFKYIVNAFALLTNEEYLRQNFDISKWGKDGVGDLNSLFFKGSNVRKKDEIEDTIDLWYDEIGLKNEKDKESSSAKDSGNKSYTLTDIYNANSFFEDDRKDSGKQSYEKMQSVGKFFGKLWERYKSSLTASQRGQLKDVFDPSNKGLLVAILTSSLNDKKAFRSTTDNAKIAEDFFDFLLNEI